MSVQKALRDFAKKTFDDDHYYPVSHSHNNIRPLALFVKKPRPIYKRPFSKSEFIAIAPLEQYVAQEKRQEFTKTVNSTIAKEEFLKIEKGIKESR